MKLTTIVLGAILHKEGLLNDHGAFRDAVIQVVEGNDKIKLLNVCFDGDTIQAPWVVEKLVAYLKGEIFWTASSCTPNSRETRAEREDLEQVVSVLVQEDILLDREGGEVSQVGDAAQTAISTEAGALHKFCDAFEAIRHAESQDDAVKQLLCFASGGAAVLDEKYAGGTGTEPGQSRFNRWVLPAEKLKDGSAAPGPSNPVGLIPIHLPTEFERGSVIRIMAEGLEKRPKWLRSKELGGAWIVLSVYGRGLSGQSTYKQAKLIMRKEKVDGNANHPAVSLHLFPVEMELSEDPNVAGNAILDFTQTKREVIRYDVAKGEICQVFSQFAWSDF